MVARIRDLDLDEIPRIQLPGARDDDLAVDLGRVGVAARDHFVLSDLVDQHRHSLTDALGELRPADLGLHGHEALDPLVLDRLRDRIGQRVGGCALDRRIGETADAIKPSGTQEVEQLPELRLGLARKTDNKGAAHDQLRALLAPAREPVEHLLGRRRTAHRPQDRLAPVL